MLNDTFWTYIRRDKRNISGWFQRVDAEIFGALLEAQLAHNVTGACAEIGVHHGKSFIPLCLALRQSERGVCIDIFDNQSLNRDQSGQGDLSLLRRNLAHFHINASQIHIINKPSNTVDTAEILENVGTVRFFHIDGGHWQELVESDLRLAAHVLAPGGIIALDDYFRADWPEVTYGYAHWQANETSGIIPFAVGSNKLYLCHKNYAASYRAALSSTFLQNYRSKSYDNGTFIIESYRTEPYLRDEASVQSAFSVALRIFRPNIYIRLARVYTKLLLLVSHFTS